ncbi:hypothetical protein B0H17DRAFT_1048014 [Mycena rosella]|uniref:RlpA-like protein double-psi beta-barrel domain-containing protein n=1 Tax=Mycena rosella TaxID=1033263 RepID=A0AAD7GNY3_MYCRO|nr:hypothetical protein B0H17DRAFT_1048014 [Mycena rosella]
MFRLASLALSALCILSLAVTTSTTSISHSTTSSPARAIAKSKYTRSHSFGDSYTFDPRDGWQTFNASNLQYKYRRDSPKDDKKDVPKKTTLAKLALPFKQAFSIAQSLGTVLNGLKGMGKPQPVIATWYTGHDLLNPSCWKNTAWAPTDASFVCALTLQGWEDKPRCFKFLELCSSPKKCVFARVVDTCAGCADASHHVDLTRAPFGELATFDEGVVTIQSRGASDPDEWFEDLWGPREN